jgi:hypothetical protein
VEAFGVVEALGVEALGVEALGVTTSEEGRSTLPTAAAAGTKHIFFRWDSSSIFL